ncbi:MAG TPA: L,D-transpeptidase [Candidatus Fermentibacter daniensis]|nr:MAG: hypothetical protein AO395_06655 [Candidatus Fermentibacter daniensis]MBP7720321.1 L,D-transpeptidase [Candidatus Fermentibacter sp.]OQC70176.1 MAG: L,D-transpeptidase catalytic domain [candidate division Hyd24-12 bacterium ADurb.Bin004]KZD18122.1 MAG: hypothetical protein AO396_02530 [Candidatus Fermentibacter daniensis]KZD18197.1 MAG: hypothetical protein AO394_04110 [Candidatus Fermentibacter daniensis]
MKTLSGSAAVLGCCLAASLAALLVMAMMLRAERSGASKVLDDARASIALMDTILSADSTLGACRDSMEYYRGRTVSLEARIAADSIASVFPGYYLIIDTGQNRFHLRMGDLLVRSGYCGTGKGWTSNVTGETWDFSTPRGLRHVLGNGTNPYWFRPDWFWLEQNAAPPDPDQVVTIPQDLSYEEQIAYYNDSLTAGERFYVRQVPGALGSYKVDLGGGVLLHYGTGRGGNVSHGCIRLSSADLEAIYRTLPIGAPVLIY